MSFTIYIFCSHAESKINEVVETPHGILVSYCLSYGTFIFQGLSASLIAQSCSLVTLALPAEMGSTGIALLSNFTITRRL